MLLITFIVILQDLRSYVPGQSESYYRVIILQDIWNHINAHIRRPIISFMVIIVIIVLHITSLVTMIVSLIVITQLIGKSLAPFMACVANFQSLTSRDALGGHSAFCTPGPVSLGDIL